MPVRSKPFYGWYIVATGFLSNFASVGLTIFAISAFIVPMTGELGWSRTAFSGAQSMASLLRGAVDPFVGPFVDRHGTRRFLLAGGLVLGLGLLALSTVHALWHFYLVWGVLVMLGGMGTGPQMVGVAISNWFSRRRGMAVAIASMGTTLGLGILVPLSGLLIEEIGWRRAWMVLALVAFVVILPPAFFWMKRRPEDIGLRPDNARPGEAERHSLRAGFTPVADDVVWTRRGAARTRTFWLILVSGALIGLSSSGLAFHMIPFLVEDKGFSTKSAVTIVGLFGLWSTASRPFWGFLIERSGSRGELAMAGFVAAAGLLIAVHVAPAAIVISALALRSFGSAGYLPGLDTIWPEYFGRMSLATVRSLASPLSVVASALGPLFPGLVKDATGSYYWAFAVCGAFYLIAGLTVLFVRRTHPMVRVGSALGA